MTELHGQPPLEFNFTVAREYARRIRKVATELRSSRVGWNVRSLTTERDFKGYFADVLADNMATADTDRERVASAFDDAATGLDQIIQSASEENNRRRLAREYFQRIEDRNWLEKGWDWIFGQEPPPRLE